jgi:phosphoribosyl 1,2-cyclic phosphodiesterase
MMEQGRSIFPEGLQIRGKGLRIRRIGKELYFMELRMCSLSSGSSGNVTYVGTPKTHILVDAGLTGKKILHGLQTIGVHGDEISGILVTHEHMDHIKGVGVLSRKFNIPIYANEGTWESMAGKIGKISSSNIRVFYTDQDFYIQDINIQPYAIPHDAADPVGFCFHCGGKKISIATDLGHTNSRIINTIADSDLLLLESNHDLEMLRIGSYPYHLKRRIMGKKGHLSNEDAGRVLVELVKRNVKHVLLGHLSKENNFPELAYQTVTSILTENQIRIDDDIRVDMTYRERISGYYQIR